MRLCLASLDAHSTLTDTTARAKPRRRHLLLKARRATEGAGHCAGPFLFEPPQSIKDANCRGAIGASIQMFVMKSQVFTDRT